MFPKKEPISFDSVRIRVTKGQVRMDKRAYGVFLAAKKFLICSLRRSPFP